jgi:hypothetical protein
MHEDKKSDYIIAAIITIITFIAFHSVGTDCFTYFDDWTYIKENYMVRQGLTYKGLLWAFDVNGYAANWHPLTWISHMIDVQICGLRAECHHTTSLLIHIINANLLFFTLKYLTKNTWPSAVVAMLFAVHPLRIESVAWISERKDVLCGFFWILTLYAYGFYAKKRNLARYFMVLLFYSASLMSKPMAVTIPFVLMLIDYWPLGRIQIWGEQGNSHSDFIKIIILEKIPFLILCLVSSAITFHIQNTIGAVNSFDNITASERVGNALISYVIYMWKMFWPDELSIFYPFPEKVSYVKAFFCAIVLIIITLFVIIQGKKKPFLPVGWFYYLGTMIPVIGLVQVGSQSMADRYTYLPSIGIMIMIVWWLFSIVHEAKVIISCVSRASCAVTI